MDNTAAHGRDIACRHSCPNLTVPTSVVISKAGLSQNSQAAWTVQIGLRVTDNGKTEAMSRRQAILSFLIGKATEKPTM